MPPDEPEGEQIQLKLDLQRRPIAERGLNVHDAAACRAWLHAQIAHQVYSEGSLAPTIRMLREGPTQEIADLEALVEPGKETILAALWRGLAQRPDIVRSFRLGELRLRDPDSGKLRRAACAMELRPSTAPGEPDGWWCAQRFFGQGEAGVGTFWGEWREAEGTGVEALEEPLRRWLDDTKADIVRTEVEEQLARSPRDLDVRMAMLPPPLALPQHPGELAVGIGRSMDAEVLAQGLSCYLVFVLDAANSQLERWELNGELPCLLDDVIRNISRLGDCYAVALVTPGTIATPEGTRRAVHTIGELKGHPVRVRRILPVTFEAGEPVAQPEVLQEMPIGEAQAWIGVEPETDLGLRMLGMADGLGGAVGEA